MIGNIESREDTCRRKARLNHERNNVSEIEFLKKIPSSKINRPSRKKNYDSSSVVSSGRRVGQQIFRFFMKMIVGLERNLRYKNLYSNLYWILEYCVSYFIYSTSNSDITR